MNRSVKQIRGGDLPTAFVHARAAVSFLEQHRLEPHLIHYQLALSYIAEPDGILAQEIDELVDGGVRLSGDEARALAKRLLPDAPVVSRDEIASHANRLTGTAMETLQTTADFGRDIAPFAADTSPMSSIAGIMLARAARAESDLASSVRELERIREELHLARIDADHDPLTGLLNRRGITPLLRDMEDHGRYAVALCDIDRFKQINDRYGHPVGDNVLRAVASTLKESCAGATVARWGGEEMLVVARDFDVPAMRALVDHARIAMAGRTFRLRDSGEPIGAVTFSAGCAGPAAAGIMEAIERADGLCYRAKESGRNCVRC